MINIRKTTVNSIANTVASWAEELQQSKDQVVINRGYWLERISKDLKAFVRLFPVSHDILNRESLVEIEKEEK